MIAPNTSDAAKKARTIESHGSAATSGTTHARAPTIPARIVRRFAKHIFSNTSVENCEAPETIDKRLLMSQKAIRFAFWGGK